MSHPVFKVGDLVVVETWEECGPALVSDVNGGWIEDEPQYRVNWQGPKHPVGDRSYYQSQLRRYDPSAELREMFKQLLEKLTLGAAHTEPTIEL